MWYAKTKIQIYNSEEWYNKIADSYSKYHDELNRDKNFLVRRFPRDIDGAVIADLWSWDSRHSKLFDRKKIKKYIWLDIADKLLKKSPSWVDKRVANLEEKRPLENESVDLCLAYFILIHLNNLEHFFAEANRVLKLGWRLILLHNIQKRAFSFHVWKETFKIEFQHHSLEDIETIWVNAGFKVKSQEFIEDTVLIAKWYCFEKDRK